MQKCTKLLYTVENKCVEYRNRRPPQPESAYIHDTLAATIIKKNKIKKSAVRSRISSKLILASCVGYFDRAYFGFYVTS